MPIYPYICGMAFFFYFYGFTVPTNLRYVATVFGSIKLSKIATFFNGIYHFFCPFRILFRKLIPYTGALELRIQC